MGPEGLIDGIVTGGYKRTGHPCLQHSAPVVFDCHGDSARQGLASVRGELVLHKLRTILVEGLPEALIPPIQRRLRRYQYGIRFRPMALVGKVAELRVDASGVESKERPCRSSG